MRRWLALLTLVGLALAGPRLGLHEGFTRLVFDLPQGASYQVVDRGGEIWIRFRGVSLEPEEVEVKSPELRSYRVERDRVLLRTAPGVRVKTFELKGLRPGTYRLVVDLVSGGEGQKPRPPRPVVVLDPGHGGPDPGAVGYVVEKEVTLDVALRVKRALEAKGIGVVLTRDRDTDLAPPGEKDLWKRKVADLKRRAEMADSQKTLFVSIHVNSAPRPARGIETYVLGRAVDPEALRLAVWENGGGEVGERLTRETEDVTSQILKDLLAQANLAFSKRLAQGIQTSLVKAANSPDRGVHTAPLYVLRYARIPAVLVEVGFANHPTEGRLLARASHRQKVAEGIAEGILGFLASANGSYQALGKTQSP